MVHAGSGAPLKSFLSSVLTFADLSEPPPRNRSCPDKKNYLKVRADGVFYKEGAKVQCQGNDTSHCTWVGVTLGASLEEPIKTYQMIKHLINFNLALSNIIHPHYSTPTQIAQYLLLKRTLRLRTRRLKLVLSALLSSNVGSDPKAVID